MTSVPLNAADSPRLDLYSTELPAVTLPRAPAAGLVWARAVTIASVFFTLYTLDRLTIVFADFWLLQSLGFESVFWTNFRMGAKLYVVTLMLFTIAGSLPAFRHRVSKYARGLVIRTSFLIATIAAFAAASKYHEFLLAGAGLTFGRQDPVFGIDLSFYIFNLGNLWIMWEIAAGAVLLMLITSVACAFASHEDGANEVPMSRFGRLVALASTPTTRLALAALAIVGAVGMWLTRYDLLTKDNKTSSIPSGAEYIDVVGLFSSLNYIWVTAASILVGGFLLMLWLKHAHEGTTGREDGDRRESMRKLAKALALVIGFDFAFKALVVTRDMLAVQPNEPVVQLPYIARHLQATREGYGLENVKEISFVPNRPGDPVASAEELLASPTLKNAPLWPGYVSYLDSIVDPQHAARILQTKGDPMVYGPSLEMFRQQQKLRTYYNFLGMDTVRYNVGGETRLFTSAIRETPLMEPVPWLTYFGQRYMLFTHGFGLVMAPSNEKTADGEPNFYTKDIPPTSKDPALNVANHRVYYGEGSATMAFSNVSHMKELDFPTEQDRAQYWLPENVKSGVHVDSMLKRLVFGWRSRLMFFQLVFSDLITDKTRVHYLRAPLERLETIAPFLFLDSNPYAVTIDGKIVWMVNAMSTTNRYPYSLTEELGDKSDERSTLRHRGRWVNYVEDSVKATIDASTGEVKLYKIADKPVINAWAKVYPGLFIEGASMPEQVRAQMSYSPQLFHIQFDDIYMYYHMNDPMYYFNMEDMWDDGDEVVGPISDSGKAITFSMEPYPWLAETGTVLPASARPTQFALAMPFSNEKAPNLRALPVVYQDPPDYGKLSVITVPKGVFFTGPEQADAAIDQDPFISQSFSWWNRRGTEVIRGHTSPLLVGKELMYVEPIFLRSQQNPVPQMKKVVVVFRGTPYMADTLEQAIRDAVTATKARATAPAAAPAVAPPQSADTVPAAGEANNG